MKKLLLLMFLISGCFMYFSCSKDEESVSDNKSFTECITQDEQINETLRVLKDFRTRTDLHPGDVTPEEAQEILQPFIARGRAYQQMILTFCNSMQNHDLVSSEDIQAINLLTDEELVYTGLILDAWMGNVSPYVPENFEVSSQQLKSCLIGLLGIAAIEDLIEKELTVKTAIQALKAVIGRTGNAIFVTVIVLEFIDCITGS